MKLIDIDAVDYIASMALTEAPSFVHGTDGGALWRIADDHFVVFVCTACPGHKGPGRLRTTLPPTWRVFHAVENPDQEFQMHHWGPVDE